MGEWTGISNTKIRRNWPYLAAAISAGDDGVVPPGGENRHGLVLRLLDVILHASELPRRNVVVMVSHLGILRTLLPSAYLPNASALWIKFDIKGLRSQDAANLGSISLNNYVFMSSRGKDTDLFSR